MALRLSSFAAPALLRTFSRPHLLQERDHPGVDQVRRLVVRAVARPRQHVEPEGARAVPAQSGAGVPAGVDGRPGIRPAPQREDGRLGDLLQETLGRGTRGAAKHRQEDLLGALVVGRRQQYLQQLVVGVGGVGVDPGLAQDAGDVVGTAEVAEEVPAQRGPQDDVPHERHDGPGPERHVLVPEARHAAAGVEQHDTANVEGWLLLVVVVTIAVVCRLLAFLPLRSLPGGRHPEAAQAADRVAGEAPGLPVPVPGLHLREKVGDLPHKQLDAESHRSGIQGLVAGAKAQQVHGVDGVPGLR